MNFIKSIVLTLSALIVMYGCHCVSNKSEYHSETSATQGEASETYIRQTTCPVMGGAINTNLYVDYNGKRIYVCCGGCVAEVKKNPDKYIKKLEAEGITLERVK